MFGKKQKSKNKFHLPVEEPKPERTNNAAGPLYSDALTTEIYSNDGSFEDVASDQAASDETASEAMEVQTHTVVSTVKYRFITSESQLTEKKPTRNWEIYYRDRDYAGGKGDPLLTVVEASSRQEAESKAQMSEGDNKGQVIAVNTRNAIVRYKKESSFAFPSAQSGGEPPPKGYRSKP